MRIISEVCDSLISLKVNKIKLMIDRILDTLRRFSKIISTAYDEGTEYAEINLNYSGTKSTGLKLSEEVSFDATKVKC